MARKKKEILPPPTKVELVKWLKEKIAAGEHESVSVDGYFDIMDLVWEAWFDKPGKDHQVYTLKMMLMDPEEVGEIYEGPTLSYSVEIDGVTFELEAPYEEVRDGVARWSTTEKLADGNGAGRFKNIDEKLSQLIAQYVECELPGADNWSLPCEGVGYETLYNAVSGLEQEGAKLYENYEVAYARYPEDDEADFAEYKLSNAEGVTNMLYESMEYECDWSPCFEKEDA